MLRNLVVFAALWAGSVGADPAQITYKGLTFGAPIPDIVVPLTSRPAAETGVSDTLPAALQNLCEHDLLPTGTGQVWTMTLECDGAVVFVDVTEIHQSFFDPNTIAPPLTPDIAGFAFKETTLAQVRTRFCSEGLVDEALYGQIDPDRFQTFRFAYDVEGTDIIAVFAFQLAIDLMFQDFAAGEAAALGHRDAATLVSVTLMVSDIFDILTDGDPRSGAGYIPLPDTLTDPAFRGLNCPVA